MGWTTPKAWVTGTKVLASDMNTFVSDNDAALRAGGVAIASQAAGDVVYASSSTQLARVAIGASDRILTSSGSAPQWSADVDIPGTLDVTSTATCDAQLAVNATAMTNCDLSIGYVSTQPDQASMGSLAAKDAAIVVGGSNTTSTRGVLFLLGQNVSSDGVSGEIRFCSGGSFNAAVQGREGASDAYGELVFSTSDGTGGTVTERMRINSAGDVSVVGALSKGSGSFRIPHPLPAKSETHALVHSFVESPETMLLYRGQATLVDGAAELDMNDVAGMTDGTWDLLCREEIVFATNLTGWSPVRGSVTGCTLTLDCQDATSTDTVAFLVTANRHDPHIMDTSWTDEEGRPIVEPQTSEPEEDV